MELKPIEWHSGRFWHGDSKSVFSFSCGRLYRQIFGIKVFALEFRALSSEVRDWTSGVEVTRRIHRRQGISGDHGSDLASAELFFFSKLSVYSIKCS